MATEQVTTPTADEVLATTRSVRGGIDTSRPVPRELIEECVTLALQAPSGSNIQNAHFVVVTDPEKRALSQRSTAAAGRCTRRLLSMRRR